MTDLHKRLSDATEGTRELDGDIERVLFPDALIMTDAGQVGLGARPAAYEPIGARPDLPGDVIAECTGVSFYTTSVDAALALASRVLQEANCRGFDQTPQGSNAYVSRNNVASGHWVVGASAKTPALALCLAILSAKATDTGVGG